MKNVKRVLALLMVLAMMAVLAGCGKMTPEKLAEKMAAALAQSPMTGETLEMEFDMAVTAQGVTLDMGVDMSMDMLMDQDPYRGYSEIEMTMELMGQSVTETSQSYMREENGAIATYTYAESAGIWQKSVVEISAEELVQNGNYDWLTGKSGEELTLEEEKQTIDGREVYVLSCTITGAEMQKVMNAMGGMSDALSEAGLSGMDMSALTVPAVFYVDAKTFLPVRMDMEIQGMDEMMAGMMEEMMGGDLASMGVEMEISNVRVSCVNIRYDAVEIPEVPQEAIDSAVEP